MFSVSEDAINKINERRKLINIEDNIKFGIEIEFSIKEPVILQEQIFNINQNYNFTHDDSGAYIHEVISPILYNNLETWNNLDNILNCIKKNNGVLTGREGGHIHYDHSILKDESLFDFLKIWCVFETIIYEFSYGDYNIPRSTLRMYCDYLRYRLPKFIEKGNINELVYFDKAYGLNLENHLFLSKTNQKPNTYEIRVPNASLETKTWQNNIEFFANLFKFCNNSNNKGIIDSLYKKGCHSNDLENAHLLANLIYDNELSKLRFLRQYCHNSKDIKSEFVSIWDLYNEKTL